MVDDVYTTLLLAAKHLWSSEGERYSGRGEKERPREIKRGSENFSYKSDRFDTLYIKSMKRHNSIVQVDSMGRNNSV